MCPGIEPGIATAHRLNRESAFVQIHLEQSCDLEFATRRGGKLCSLLRRRAVKTIKPGHRVMRGGVLRFLDDPTHGAVGIEIKNTIALWIGHTITEHRAASFASHS